ncbi:MAG: hypothetical protein LBL47_03115, partial [Lactobacillus sp.]|nr:hypothetical protein [Lactobacillus sp.]
MVEIIGFGADGDNLENYTVKQALDAIRGGVSKLSIEEAMKYLDVLDGADLSAEDAGLLKGLKTHIEDFDKNKDGANGIADISEITVNHADMVQGNQAVLEELAKGYDPFAKETIESETGDTTSKAHKYENADNAIFEDFYDNKLTIDPSTHGDDTTPAQCKEDMTKLAIEQAIAELTASKEFNETDTPDAAKKMFEATVTKYLGLGVTKLHVGHLSAEDAKLIAQKVELSNEGGIAATAKTAAEAKIAKIEKEFEDKKKSPEYKALEASVKKYEKRYKKENENEENGK